MSRVYPHDPRLIPGDVVERLGASALLSLAAPRPAPLFPLAIVFELIDLIKRAILPDLLQIPDCHP